MSVHSSLKGWPKRENFQKPSQEHDQAPQLTDVDMATLGLVRDATVQVLACYVAH